MLAGDGIGPEITDATIEALLLGFCAVWALRGGRTAVDAASSGGFVLWRRIPAGLGCPLDLACYLVEPRGIVAGIDATRSAT